MDLGELGKTTGSVSNYRVNIDYYIGLLYNSVDISVWDIQEQCIEIEQIVMTQPHCYFPGLHRHCQPVSQAR
jgi:hypothetical protein